MLNKPCCLISCGLFSAEKEGGNPTGISSSINACHTVGCQFGCQLSECRRHPCRLPLVNSRSVATCSSSWLGRYHNNHTVNLQFILAARTDMPYRGKAKALRGASNEEY